MEKSRAEMDEDELAALDAAEAAALSTVSKKITMSNALTRAGHGLTLAEKRLVLSSVATLDSRKNPRPGESPFVKITAAEYSENFGVDMDTAYRQLREGADNLLKRLITFYVPAFNRKGKPIEDAISKMRWVGKVTYHQKEGWVELHFWHEVVPHLLGLKKQFTSYQLQQASALRSVYSWKLLELLMRFKDTGWAEYAIEDFCESMEATENQRADFGQIRRRMIEPAVKELAEKDGWRISWRPIKAGRKVKALHFDFERDPQGRLELDNPSTVDNSKVETVFYFQLRQLDNTWEGIVKTNDVAVRTFLGCETKEALLKAVEDAGIQVDRAEQITFK